MPPSEWQVSSFTGACAHAATFCVDDIFHSSLTFPRYILDARRSSLRPWSALRCHGERPEFPVLPGIALIPSRHPASLGASHPVDPAVITGAGYGSPLLPSVACAFAP